MRLRSFSRGSLLLPVMATSLGTMLPPPPPLLVLPPKTAGLGGACLPAMFWRSFPASAASCTAARQERLGHAGYEVRLAPANGELLLLTFRSNSNGGNRGTDMRKS